MVGQLRKPDRLSQVLEIISSKPIHPRQDNCNSDIQLLGDLERLDIGIPRHILADLPRNQPLRISFSDLSTFTWPKPSKDKSKYQRGRVLVVAGSEKYRGAAFLALNGALGV